jgi:hypothetical protein
MSCVDWSEYDPVALNCSVNPLATLGFAGVTAIDCNAAAVTVSFVEPETVPSFALIVDWPVPAAVASPVLLTVATVVADEAHVTWLVKFWTELSEYVPVAVNCSVSPLGTLGFVGVTAIDSTTGAVTVNGEEPLIDPSVAVIFAVP